MAAADGYRAGAGSERVSGTVAHMSPSAAGDNLEELTSVLRGWEDAYRELRGWPSLARRGHLAAAVTTCIAWLMLHLDEIITTPFAEDLGAEILQWHRELTGAAKAGQRTLKKPLRCPRRNCQMLLLTWTEGDSHVVCNNPDCQLRIPLAEYEAEAERRAAALERGDLETENA
jgi:hypothetical protein